MIFEGNPQRTCLHCGKDTLDHHLGSGGLFCSKQGKQEFFQDAWMTEELEKLIAIKNKPVDANVHNEAVLSAYLLGRRSANVL